MDFPSLQAQMSYWLANISQRWGQNGEKGIDIRLPFHSAVYSPVAGVVKGSQVDASGQSVWLEVAPDKMFYFQHLDTTALNRGQYVQPGDYVGLSGGQNVGGMHPASPQFSTGPHIEVGFNWWQPLGKNFNPLPTLQTLAAAYGEGPAIPTRKTGDTVTLASNCGKGWGVFQDTTSPNVALCALLASSPELTKDFPCASVACIQLASGNPIIQGGGAIIGGAQQAGSMTQQLFAWISNPLRIVKLVLGAALIIVALLLAFREPIVQTVGTVRRLIP